MTTGRGARSDSFSKRWSSISSRRLTGTRVSFGSSKPMRPLPGIGAMMRTLRDRPSARSSDMAATLLTLVPASGDTSYVVTVGPGWISSTLPVTP